MGWATNLSANDRELIARMLFKVTEKNGNWVNGLCPLHGEKNPSFGYNVAEDVFHCHTDCTKDGDLIDLFCLVNGLEAAAGFVEFKSRYGENLSADVSGSGKSKKKPAAEKAAGKKKADEDLPEVDLDQMAAAYESFDELPESWINRLLEIRGWKRETIQAMGMKKQTKYRCKYTGNLKPVSDSHARIAIPIYDDSKKLVNIRLYKPDAKEAKIISWGRGIGQNRLYPWPEAGGNDVAWICEGEADTICARSHGLEAYTQTAKRKNWPHDQVKQFAGRDVVIAYDADIPGQNYAKSAAASLAGVARSVRVIRWPAFMLEDGALAKKHGQDLTDYFVTHKKLGVDLINLLAEAEEVKKLDIDAQIRRFFDFTIAGRESFLPRLLADQLRRDVDLLYDPETSKLFRWNGRCYEEYDEHSLKKMAIEYLGTEALSNRYNDAVNQAVFLSTKPSNRAMDDYGNLLCLRNGMFNTDTFELKPHDKEYLATIQIDLEFDPENPEDCPRWKQFLKETIQTPEVIEQLQEFFGLCLTQDKRYEKCLIMIGDGGDGKSTSQNILKNMVGRQNCSAIGFDALQDQFQRVMLHKKLVNLSSEVSGKPMDAEYFKKIVSGDEISASYKHQNGFSFETFCKLVFAVNKMPKVIDTTDGLYRKLLPVRFKVQYLSGNPNRDPHLIEKLMAELPGIFGWAVLGLARLRERGDFNMDVPETQDLIHGYRRGNNPVYAFVEDCLEFTGEDVDEVTKAAIYEKYKSYCGKNGYGAASRSNFFIDLRLAVKAYKQSRPVRDGKRVAIVSGIRLKDGLDLD